MIKGLGEFTSSLYQKFEKRTNVFFSGYSISSAMSLAYLGAMGETKRQMAEGMGYTLEAPEVVNALLDIGTALNTKDGKIQTAVGNALWIQHDLEIAQEFLKAAQNVSDLIRKVDYVNASEAARQEVNKWVSEKTRKMITEVIPKGLFSSETRLVITNAIYFNGKWASEFDPEVTKDADFYNLNGTKSTIKLMYKNEYDCKYYEDWAYQAVALPYGDKQGRNAEMLVVLPKEDHFDSVDNLITYSILKKIATKAEAKKVKLWLPKFKLKYKKDIAGLLEQDMPLAFSDVADFSGITGGRDLTVSNVIHEAVVDVTEEGTEAAAATAVIMRLCCSVPLTNPEVRVDRPFMFAIWDSKNQVPVFMGRVVGL